MINCTGRKCLRFVNPEEYPDAVWGTPYVFDENCGCCIDCQSNYEESILTDDVLRQEGICPDCGELEEDCTCGKSDSDIHP